MKRTVTIQDISCFGKCSVTVALPLVSAMGVECAVIPTAVLSTHTGGFTGYTFRDLSDDIPKISEHWQREGIKFDGMYTGYLGSPEQAQMVIDFADAFRPFLIFVDPAMADNGKLYAGFGGEIVDAMAKLCSKADVIIPNLTEAALMLGEEFRRAGEYDREYIKNLLVKLAKLGAKKAIVTGVNYDGAHQGAAAYDSESGEFYEYLAENIPASFHGTGDVFSSVVFGALMRDRSLEDSIKMAVDFTVSSIKHTVGDENHKYSVKFEECIPELVDALR